jgi:hypothetical protein
MKEKFHLRRLLAIANGSDAFIVRSESDGELAENSAPRTSDRDRNLLGELAEVVVKRLFDERVKRARIAAPDKPKRGKP